MLDDYTLLLGRETCRRLIPINSLMMLGGNYRVKYSYDSDMNKMAHRSSMNKLPVFKGKVQSKPLNFTFLADSTDWDKRELGTSFLDAIRNSNHASVIGLSRR